MIFFDINVVDLRILKVFKFKRFFYFIVEVKEI